MNDGSAFGRLIQSGKHDARNVPGSASIADAYGPLNIVDCAACHADSNFETVMLSYRHSIRNEPRFCSVFRAFLNALKSRMQVLSDHWAHGIYDFGLPILPQADASRPKFNHQVPQTFAVRFDLRISLHLVDESTHLSSSQCILHDDLQSWKAKPWKLKHRKQKRIDAEGSDAFFQESSCDGSTMCCSNQDPSQDSKISSFHLFSQSTSEETQVASRVSAPLSPVAVLSFPRDCNDTADNCPWHDPVSIMQTQVSSLFTAKNDLFSETPGLLPQAVAQGQIDVTQFGHQPEEDGGVPEGAETSTDESSADTVDQEVPSHVARQDVLLFHLRDHPIRAMLNWNSYEEMMTEIAHHFSVRRLDLVEAYEVAATPPDLGQDVVPIVVHMIGDIPPTFDAQLVLADLEFHGHQVEEHFQLGPLLARHVILVPTMADRQIFLRAADVDRYCASESGRCLAYHNLIRWPDYDTAAR